MATSEDADGNATPDDAPAGGTLGTGIVVEEVTGVAVGAAPDGPGELAPEVVAVGAAGSVKAADVPLGVVLVVGPAA